MHAFEPTDNNHLRSGMIGPIAIAAAVTLLHLLTNSRYGFHRDELQFLTDARHLDWGFVAYPPFTPFVQRVSLQLFGLSLVGLRLASVLAQAIVIVVAGLMARELGGGRLAQATAALTVALAPLALFEGTEFQYTTFDYLWWVLSAYFVIRLLKSDDPRWCLAIGAVAGVGLMTKYTMGFFLAGVLGGLVLSRARKFLISKWFWAGILLALLICLPNLIWQAKHGYISLHFLQSIHKRDVGQGRAHGFLWDQLRICTNLVSVPLWIAGLICYLRDQRYRMLGWMYLVPLTLFLAGQGRGYYLAAAYPMLLAMGAVAGERWVTSLSRAWRWTVQGLFFTGVVAYGLIVAAIIVPVAQSGPLKTFALKNNGDLREEIGWNDLVQAIARVRDSLPEEQRANFGIVVGNYGEGGAIEILGPAYHLPPPISLTNSAWLRGYPSPPPSTLIIIGWSRAEVDDSFTNCVLNTQYANHEGVENEESRGHQDIFICGPPRKPWPEFWKHSQRFG